MLLIVWNVKIIIDYIIQYVHVFVQNDTDIWYKQWKHIPVNNTNLLSKAAKKSIGKEHKRWYKVLIMGKSIYKTNTLKLN